MRLITLFLLSLLAGPVRGNDVPEGRVGTLQFLDDSITAAAFTFPIVQPSRPAGP